MLYDMTKIYHPDTPITIPVLIKHILIQFVFDDILNNISLYIIHLYP